MVSYTDQTFVVLYSSVNGRAWVDMYVSDSWMSRLGRKWVGLILVWGKMGLIWVNKRVM